MAYDGSSFDPNFTPLNTVDLESQRVLGDILAADEADDDDSDVEITPPPTQATTLRKQSTCGTGRALKSKKPMLQSTIDGGIVSSSSSKASKRKTKTKSIHFTIRGGRKSSRLTQGNDKKKKKIQEEQLDSEGEFEEDEMENEMENEKEGRQWSDVWPHFTKIRNSNGEEKAKCNYCKNDYAWSSHGHGTSGAMLRIEMAGRERRVGTSQLPSVAHVLMKIGVPRACTAKACASRGSGLGSTSRNRIPRRPVPPRPSLTVYRGGGGGKAGRYNPIAISKVG
ncbi:hypothetical protein F2Q69_00012513 [Brassica cretica]|uniref:BED-type domain-containing protein n=1 Tax=Brassica cretica TaxID=69181 RepID=A0A8S9R4T5_BRACR|nr:hypothetical protein F2Q69_00012513 [Brassica cretica]